uniref:F-box domain-containing protein n=1 Tax=Steinernema glaseri TaxID=37863 RepID=A0A1I7YR38_9BILA
MDFVPNVFIERVTSILSLRTLDDVRRRKATLGRWFSAHRSNKALVLHIAFSDGKKYYGCQPAGRTSGRTFRLQEVLPFWDNATCYAILVSIRARLWKDFHPMSDNDFATLKKMISRQRLRIESVVKMISRQRHRIECVVVGEMEGLKDNVAEILEVCGGVDQLQIRSNRDIAPIAPTVKKLILDGGVYSLRMHQKSCPDWLLPTLTKQVQAGLLSYIYLELDENEVEVYESLIRMAVKHILEQEHGYYSLLYPTKYTHLLGQLQSALKYVSSEKTKQGQRSHYSHPGKESTVVCTRKESTVVCTSRSDNVSFTYEWRKHKP